jgi:hypothetical protein
MRCLSLLLRDDRGLVLSSEMVLVGTLGVIGATVGLKAAADSVDAELRDFARAIRSLDQSYCFEGTRGCGAWTAGSSFRQEPVEESLAELEGQMEEHEERLERQLRDRDDDDDRKRDDGKDDDDRRKDDDKDDDDRKKSAKDDDRDDDRKPDSRKDGDRDDNGPAMKRESPEKRPEPKKPAPRKSQPREVQL